MEIWESVCGYDGLYEVSNLGNIKSLFRLDNKGRKVKERILKSCIDSSGYMAVALSKNGKAEKIRVHQLVAESFLRHVRNGVTLVVNHINFDKTDNRVENLEIVTSRENSNLKHIKSSSQYVGVRKGKNDNKYVAVIYKGKKAIYLGRFINEYDAHLAYQKALSEIG